MLESTQNLIQLGSHNDCHRICEKKHDSHSLIGTCKLGCNINKLLGNLESNVPQTTLSEQLKGISDNLSADSFKLSLIADNLDSVF